MGDNKNQIFLKKSIMIIWLFLVILSSINIVLFFLVGAPNAFVAFGGLTICILQFVNTKKPIIQFYDDYAEYKYSIFKAATRINYSDLGELITEGKKFRINLKSGKMPVVLYLSAFSKDDKNIIIETFNSKK